MSSKMFLIIFFEDILFYVKKITYICKAYIPFLEIKHKDTMGINRSNAIQKTFKIV